jgi:serine/threonine-protein kinase
MKECPACHRCFPDQVNHCPRDGDSLKFLIPLDTVLDERYQLEKKLGQGGMGMVFKARHVFIKTQHAIKIILPDLVGNDPSLTTRFRQEAMAAAAIRHPNTVSVTDYGTVNGTMPYLVMEFVEGRSLHELLVQEKRLTPAVAVEIMLAVCAGVAAAHHLEIVHRDLKPLNILLKSGVAPGEGVKVLDFGLAKIKSGELLGSFVAAQTQGMMGSPFYMAPEQWSDEDVDVRADIYSLGVILYQMLAGDVPFKGVSVPSIMNKHLTAAPVPLSERGVEVPPLLEQAVQHALRKDPKNRPQTVEEFVAELRAALPSLGAKADDAPQQGVGAKTVLIGPTDTTGLPDKRVLATGEHGGARSDSLKTVASFPDANSIAALEGETGQAAGGPSEARTEALTGDQRVPRPVDTASGQPAHTFGQAVEGVPTQHLVAGEARTEPLSGVIDTRRVEEERRRAAALQQQEDEQRRLAAEERQRRETEERLRREALERERREVEEQQAAARAAQQHATNAGFQPGPNAAQATEVVAPRPAPSRALFVVLGGVVALVLLAGVGGVAYYAIRKGRTEPTPTPTPATTPTPKPTVEVPRPDVVWLPGGTFRMGRADVPPFTDELKKSREVYLRWTYNQWPAHLVTVKPFAIDRTEVTNAEYAAFVKAKGHAPPVGWDGEQPKSDEGNLPVGGVSLADAEAFAAWRSERDGVTYRLPTEEEWEYAARGGESARSYPWGDSWADGYANLGHDAARPVGSFPQGRTPQGLEDMIGNVWEWTTSAAATYKGNDRTVLAPADRGKLVIRGGSYKSSPDGDEPVTVTSRRWVERDFRDPALGFRLVRAEP